MKLQLLTALGLLFCESALALREFNTDRPDKTETPYTVDAGHFQFETDLVTYTRDKDSSGTVTEKLGINHINLKYGVLPDFEVQTIVQMFTKLDVGAQTKKGLGDVLVRAKYNLLGNDGGPVSIGVMPYLKVPTNGAGIGNQSLEGGLIFLTSVPLPKGFILGTMLQGDLIKDPVGLGYHFEYISTATMYVPICGEFGGYTEIFSKASALPSDAWEATFDVGLTYQFIPNWQADAGVNIGLTEAADDWNPFVGLSARF